MMGMGTVIIITLLGRRGGERREGKGRRDGHCHYYHAPIGIVVADAITKLVQEVLVEKCDVVVGGWRWGVVMGDGRGGRWRGGMRRWEMRRDGGGGVVIRDWG